MAYLRDNKGCQCMGIEPHPESAIAAESAGFVVSNEDALTGIEKIKSSHKYDHIIFGDVLEHMVDPMPVLLASKSLLKPGGSIVISLPNIVGPRGRVPIIFGIWRYKESGIFDKTHLRFYSVKTGRELIQNAGYEIVNEVFVGPLTTLGGRAWKHVTGLRPNLLANQMIFDARPANIGLH